LLLFPPGKDLYVHNQLSVPTFDRCIGLPTISLVLSSRDFITTLVGPSRIQWNYIVNIGLCTHSPDPSPQVGPGSPIQTYVLVLHPTNRKVVLLAQYQTAAAWYIGVLTSWTRGGRQLSIALHLLVKTQVDRCFQPADLHAPIDARLRMCDVIGSSHYEKARSSYPGLYAGDFKNLAIWASACLRLFFSLRVKLPPFFEPAVVIVTAFARLRARLF